MFIAIYKQNVWHIKFHLWVFSFFSDAKRWKFEAEILLTMFAQSVSFSVTGLKQFHKNVIRPMVNSNDDCHLSELGQISYFSN